MQAAAGLVAVWWGGSRSSSSSSSSMHTHSLFHQISEGAIAKLRGYLHDAATGVVEGGVERCDVIVCTKAGPHDCFICERVDLQQQQQQQRQPAGHTR